MKENIAINEEIKGSNKLAVIGHSVVVLGVIGIYVMEYLKGVNGLGLTAFMIAYCITPAVIECVIYSKRPDHPAIKHLLGYGFPSFYVIMLITSSNPLAFTFAIATLILATAYADSAYIKKECIGTVIINIVNVILLYKKGVYGPDTSVAVATHIISMTIISVYFYMSTRRVETNSLTQVERINVSANKTQSLLDNILEITKELNEEIADIHDLTGELGESIKETSSAMSEVNAGSTDTANAVQNQLVLTENIKNNINDVKSETSEIGKKVEETLEALRQGNKKINDLLKESEAAVENGNDVTRKLTKLDEIMENMYSVVGIITDITSQTSLLSLNASIEAARAGEAGRGFAVVASEIQKMANDTQLAANQIKEMIDNVSNSITEVVEATKGILVNITDQAETTNLTAESFRIIETNTEDIAASSGSLSKSVEILETANNEIVDSISTISAISEEVTAHANDTFASSEKDSERIHHVIASADKLKELSKKLSV